ncbi:MAG TPA: L-lactate dehydrogenase [Firmicutes bacterium]|nr:L-lactate dehydrogenase [Bacillota bacterium]
MARLSFQKPSKVSIVGTGLVGATYAYTLLLRGTTDEICLIDKHREKALGESMDLNHAMPLMERTNIWAGSLDDLVDSDLIVIAAGASQKSGETRMDLLEKNAQIVGDIAEKAGRLCPESIILVVTNPVDVMSYVALERSGLSPERVIGSGTVLDTARLRYVLGDELGIDPKGIHASVIGEHGDSEIVAWSRATIAGTSLENWIQLTEAHREEVFLEVRDAAYDIIDLKGATYYAISMAMARITEAIIKDLRSVYSVSAYLNGEYGVSGIYLGTPSVVGKEGILRVIELPLSGQELKAFRKSGETVKKAIKSLGLKPALPLARKYREAAGFHFSTELDAGICEAREESTAFLKKPKKPVPIRTQRV